jgi:hypothetical protein
MKDASDQIQKASVDILRKVNAAADGCGLKMYQTESKCETKVRDGRGYVTVTAEFVTLFQADKA